MLFFTIILLSILFNQLVNAAPTSVFDIKYPLTREEAFHRLKDKSDFIFDFYNPRPIDIIEGADAGRTVRAKGTNFPMLLNNGLSMSLSVINPCGVVLPHIHPRASQIYYIIEGEFELGFIQENGANFTQQIIKQGQCTIFPQGSIHYFINTQCKNSSLVAVANSDDPGRIDVATNFFKVLSKSIISAALGNQNINIEQNKIPTVDPAQGTGECRKRCNIK